MMIGRLRHTAIFTAVLGTLGQPGVALAHPHVFVDGKAEIVFDAGKHITAIRNIWQFDEAYSAFATVGLDKNGDGRLSRQELAPLAKVNIDSLKEYAYFTYLSVGKRQLAFKPPVDYVLTEAKGRLTLAFTLPLAQPATVASKMTLEVFDPEYFVAFTFPERGAVELADAPAQCSAVFHPPHVLDTKIMAQLATIPVEQRNLPAALQSAAVGLANLFTVECPA
jgi:ABC-type uncharacterized transport system substrate-binding protein